MLNSVVTGCHDLDSLFSLVENDCSKPNLQRCTIGTVPGKYCNSSPPLKYMSYHKRVPSQFNQFNAHRKYIYALSIYFAYQK